jgi:NADH-quinone oxidoreductase subunit L
LTYLALIFLLPLAGAAVNGIFWRRLRGNVPGFLASATVFVALVLTFVAFLKLLSLPAEERIIRFTLYEWISVGSFHVPLGFRFDALSMTWTLIVTGVGFLIHVYAIGYMSHEDTYSRSRFFCYMNLFIFAMLILVMADSLPLLFLGWEGVGLCSYLLIAYYYDKGFAAEAGKKAFIVNRIGDVAFLLGMFWIFVEFGDVRFDGLFQVLEDTPPELGSAVVTGIAILLFIGAVGKSAQIPLYVWLPDAMAGPTPVSALIHAATMVTAGIYMVCRMSPLISFSPTAMLIIAVIGCLTALLAGIIGICQRDIKKVLAYSTVSQLGYMFLACGVGAFTAGVFHVTTHAFFKALLFLGAGCVIHAMHEEQDIFKMGELRKKLHGLFIAFSAGALALAGVIPFAGFFSKDEILWSSFASGHYLLWFLGVATAGITAFYTARLVYVTFVGQSRMSPEKWESVHDTPKLMNWPVYTLAGLSVIGGVLGIPAVFGHIFHIPNFLGDFLAPVFATAHANAAALHGEAHGSAALEFGLMALSLLVVFGGMGLAYNMYRRGMAKAEATAVAWPNAHRWVWNKFYVDEFYHDYIVKKLKKAADFCGRFDLGVIDGLVNLTAKIVDFFGILVRVTQTGVVHSYAFWFIVGALAMVWYILAG